MFSRIFIERPRLAVVVSLALAIAGALCIGRLPIAEYPEIAPPQISISAAYTGASARVVMETVAIPLEAEINGVEGLQYFSSTSGNDGGYSCSITFKSGTNSDMAMVNVQNAVKRAEAKLPSEVTRNGIAVNKSTSDILEVLTFTTDGSSMSIIELSNYVGTTVKDALSRIDGVASVSVMGAKDYAMRIWLDPMRLAGLGLSTSDITRAIETQNVQAAAGFVGAEDANGYVQYKLNTEGRLATADEFAEVVVRSDGEGGVLRLRDVARVELGAETYAGNAAYNENECVALAVTRNSDANALATVRLVNNSLAGLSSRFPAGVAYNVAYDPTEFIVISLREIVETLVVALALVILITYVFLQDWRATLIPGLAIPVSLLATFPVMLALGYSINVLTMFGLILVIGSLVDDAIVVVENTMALMEREGLGAKEAAIKSMGQITGAVIATTLVTIACYVPLAFYGGMVGAIYRQFAVTMCVALCFSTVVALTLSPMLCAFFLRPRSRAKPSRLFAPFNWLLNGSRRVYLFGARALVRRGALTAALFVGVLGCVYGLFGQMRSSFLPGEDKGTVMVNVQLPEGATLARTDAALAQLRGIMAETEGVQSVMTVSGHSMLMGSGENAAMAIAKLAPWDDRKTPDLQLNAILGALQRESRRVSPASTMFFTPPAIMGLGVSGGVSFRIAGEGDVDEAELSEVARKFAGELSARPEAMYALSTYNADTPQLRLDLDREKAETLGVPPSRVYSTLQGKLASFYINDFYFQGNSFKVKMQADSEFRSLAEDIHDIQIPSDSGEMVPLSSLATVAYTVGPKQIQRFNKMVSAEISAQTAPGASTSSLMSAVEGMELPRGYHIEWTGTSYEEKQNQGQIVGLMALALLFAYLFLVAQYESWTMPVSVMLSVAFAVLGALLGLFVMRMEMSIYAQLGLVMLIGLAAKNAILMVEFSKQERERGLSVEESAMNGASLRYRAVLMTAWSFLFGVAPLVVATGAGAASRQAIGVTTFSGMAVATLVGIIFVPALYALCQRAREWAKATLWRGETDSERKTPDSAVIAN